MMFVFLFDFTRYDRLWYNGISLNHKKEQNWVSWSDVDGPRLTLVTKLKLIWPLFTQDAPSPIPSEALSAVLPRRGRARWQAGRRTLPFPSSHCASLFEAESLVTCFLSHHWVWLTCLSCVFSPQGCSKKTNRRCLTQQKRPFSKRCWPWAGPLSAEASPRLADAAFCLRVCPGLFSQDTSLISLD